MNKVFLLPAKEDWIVDRFVNEWSKDNADITTRDPYDADILWLLASWRWRHLPFDLLMRKKVLATVHHIVPEKFDDSKKIEFMERDRIVSAYHVYNQTTGDIVSSMSKKPVHLIQYWANQNIWRKTGEKIELRKKHGLPEDCYLVGSFQRDTEGSDLASPKLEKGPDLLADFLVKANGIWENWAHRTSRGRLHVVLAGWRRQYIISRLNEAAIPFTFFDRPDQEVVNELYQTLDLYPVTSRHEGGPQSLIECGLLGVDVVSRNVGIANQVLAGSAVNDDVSLATPSIPNVSTWQLPGGYSPYRQFFAKM